MTGTKTVTVFVAVNTGSKNESDTQRGLSHFLEHMMFKGTVKRPTSLAISEELDAVGGEFERCGARELGDDIDAVYVASQAGEQSRHVAAAGTHFENTVGARDGQALEHARLKLGREHRFAVAERYFHVDESQFPVWFGDIIFAVHAEQQVEYLLIEHFPRSDLLFDHVEARML